MLAIGSKSDPVLKDFKEYVEQSQIDAYSVFFLWEEDFGETIQVNDKGWTIKSEEVILHEQVRGVLNRLVSQKGQKSKNEEVYCNILMYCNYLMDEVYPQVCNRPKDGMSNYSKLVQLASIKPKVVKVPMTKVCANTQWKEEYSELMWVFKSASSVRSIATILSKQDKKRQINEPVIFQEYLKGRNVRVHVIGDRCIAHFCISKKTDYRYGETSILPIVLPEDVKMDCIEITKQLGLNFSGIDLIETGLGWFILEANTAAGYSYFESHAKEVSRTLCQHWAEQE